MNHDPYVPPQTAVNDIVAAPGQRPGPVNIALILLAIVIAQTIWAGYGEITQLGHRPGPMTNAIFVLRAAKILVAIGLWVAIARGQDWARLAWLFLVLFMFIIGGAVFVYVMRISPAPANALTHASFWIGSALPYVLNCAALYLLFFPGKHWFKR